MQDIAVEEPGCTRVSTVMSCGPNKPVPEFCAFSDAEGAECAFSSYRLAGGAADGPVPGALQEAWNNTITEIRRRSEALPFFHSIPLPCFL